MAPAHEIFATTIGNAPEGNYLFNASGTSLACPHVAGIAALMLSVNNDLTWQEVKNIIEITACPIALPAVFGEIAQNTIWNTSKHAVQDIIIPSGITLTISSIIKCDYDIAFIVHPGGKLIIDGGALTNACEGKRWKGITVLGNSTQPINTNYQGYVEVKNGGKIENASCGITAIEGGIVKTTTSAHFANNTISVKIEPVAIGQTGTSGSFSNTYFYVDQNYLGDITNFETHLKIQNSGSVYVYGCEFYGSSHHFYSPFEQNYGIWAINSSLTVTEFCPSGIFSSDGKCRDGVPSKFKYLKKSILASNTGTLPTVKVRFSEFEDNLDGIIINSINNFEVIRNKFLFRENCFYGLFISNSTGYKIEENEFRNMDLYNRHGFGLIIFNSGIAENEIYKNHFFSVFNGQSFLKETPTKWK